MSPATLRRLLVAQPVLTGGAFGALGCYAITSLSYPTIHSVSFLPLVPGGLLLLLLGVLFVYSPVYALALAFDLRRLRGTNPPEPRIRVGMLAIGSQVGYFLIPLIQAHDSGFLDTLIFGIAEFGLISIAAIATLRHLRVRR